MREGLFDELEEIREMLLSAPPNLPGELLNQMLKEIFRSKARIPPELVKLLLKAFLLSGSC